MEPAISQRKLAGFYATSNANISFNENALEISKEIYSKLGSNVLDILGQMYEEQKDHNYANPHQNYVKHRRVVAEWMIDVCDYFNLHPTTTHMSINYLDRIQPNDKFSRFEWQMIAICCIVIASKYNECESHVPELAQLEEITHQQIPNATFLSYELWTLKRMGWKLHARTTMNFLNCYMVLGVITPDADRFLRWAGRAGGDEIVTAIPEYVTTVLAPKYLYTLATLTLTDLRFKPHLASDIAAAIVYVTRRNLCITPVWNRPLSTMTGCSDPSLFAEVISMLDALGAPAIERVLQHEDYLYHAPFPANSLGAQVQLQQQQQQHQRTPLQQLSGNSMTHQQQQRACSGDQDSQESGDPLNDTINSDEGEYEVAQQYQHGGSSDIVAGINAYMHSMSLGGVQNAPLPPTQTQVEDQNQNQLRVLPPAPATAVKTIPAEGQGGAGNGISPQSIAVDDAELVGLRLTHSNSDCAPEGDESCVYADCSSGDLSALCARGSSDSSMVMESQLHTAAEGIH